MLHYFPMIYPDELWYSVISRYHIYSGNTSSMTTCKQLFAEHHTKSIRCFFPNNTIYWVSQNLSKDALNINDIILNHTLFKYFCRMYSQERKKYMLDKISHGQDEGFANKIKKTEKNPNYLKICPLCKKEDLEKFEVSYWHLSHQLPQTNICIRHKCRLIPVFFDVSTQLQNQFMVPDESLEYEVDFQVSENELNLAKMFDDYLHLPLLVGPTDEHNNLYQGLLNKGYGVAVNNNIRSLDLKRIYADLVDFFGAEIVLNIFGEKLENQEMKHIKQWIILSPVRYILLCTLIKQKANITFSTRKIDDVLKKRFQELSNEKQLMQKEDIAERLGLSVKSMVSLARYYEIKPFWLSGRQYRAKRVATIAVVLTKEEFETITNYYKKNGYTSMSPFLRDCVARVVDFT